MVRPSRVCDRQTLTEYYISFCSLIVNKILYKTLGDDRHYGLSLDLKCVGKKTPIENNYNYHVHILGLYSVTVLRLQCVLQCNSP